LFNSPKTLIGLYVIIPRVVIVHPFRHALYLPDFPALCPIYCVYVRGTYTSDIPQTPDIVSPITIGGSDRGTKFLQILVTQDHMYPLPMHKPWRPCMHICKRAIDHRPPCTQWTKRRLQAKVTNIDLLQWLTNSERDVTNARVYLGLHVRLYVPLTTNYVTLAKAN